MSFHRLLIVLLLWNTAVFLLYALDKVRARRRRGRRVPERTLLLCALAGGGAGALLGMELLRHKTRHTRFRILVPLGALLLGAALWWARQQLG